MEEEAGGGVRCFCRRGQRSLRRESNLPSNLLATVKINPRVCGARLEQEKNPIPGAEQETAAGNGDGFRSPGQRHADEAQSEVPPEHEVSWS